MLQKSYLPNIKEISGTSQIHKKGETMKTLLDEPTFDNEVIKTPFYAIDLNGSLFIRNTLQEAIDLKNKHLQTTFIDCDFPSGRKYRYTFIPIYKVTKNQMVEI